MTHKIYNACNVCSWQNQRCGQSPVAHGKIKKEGAKQDVLKLPHIWTDWWWVVDI